MCLALPIVGQAQSAHWALTPTYQSMSRFAPRLFKVKTYVSTGILDVDDKWVVSPSLDSITYVTNGYALGLLRSKDKYRIIHVIRQNGTHEPVKEELYAGDFAYFSEDRCPVMNKKGKYGFMDPAGKLVVSCSYTAVTPFRNGVAFVTKAKGGFSGKNAVSEIDANGKVNKNGGNSNFSIPAQEIATPYIATPDPAYQRYNENKLYGYKIGNEILLPAQFEEAENISDDCAIVMVDHLYGVIKVNSATIDCSVSESGGKLKAEAEIPSVWDNKVATIIRTVNGASRKEFEMQGTETQRTLNTSVSNESGKKVYDLACDKLILWRSSIKTESASKRGDSGKSSSKGGVSVSTSSSIKANAKGVCSVAIRVVNNTGSSNTFNISLSTGQKSSIKLAAGKSGSVTVSVPVTKDTKCTITARGGGFSSSCTTTLKPSFVL